MDIKQVIIWGHKTPGHTHYWIHYAFERAFKYLQYNVIWVNDNQLSLSLID